MIYYRIRVIQQSFPNAYHIVNTKTNVTQSMWGSYEDALNTMRDLNALERRKAKEKGEVIVRSDTPLYLVKNN